MALQAQTPPPGLLDAVRVKYRCEAVLSESVIVDYRSEQRPLWNGTVHVIRLRRRAWPNRLFAFPGMGAKKGEWTITPHSPRLPSPLEAVKAALRKRWVDEVESGSAHRNAPATFS